MIWECRWSAGLPRRFALTAGAVSLFFCASAHAQEMAPASAELQLTRASLLLEQAAESGRAGRHAAFVVGLSTAAVLVPTGLALDIRGGDVPRTVGTGLLASAGGSLFVSVLALKSSASEELFDSFNEWRASGLRGEPLLERTEREWGARAQASAARRTLAGTVETAGGGLFMLSGSALLLASPVFGLSRAAQYRVGSLLLGSGVPFLSFGIHSLFIKSPLETSWAAYRAGQASAPARSTISLNALPLAGGIAFVASAEL